MNENQFLVDAMFMGVLITFTYDLLRILRRVIPHGSFLVSMEDLFFWIYCSAEVFLLMYHEGNGNLRWFAVLGAMTGMFLYKKIISDFFVRHVSKGLKKVLGFLGKILMIVFRPVRFALGKSAQFSRKSTGKLKKILSRMKRRLKLQLTKCKKMLKINLKA